MRYHRVLLKIHNALCNNDFNVLESLCSNYSVSSIFLWCFIIEYRKEKTQFEQESMVWNVKKLKRSRKEKKMLCWALSYYDKKNQREWMFSRVSLQNVRKQRASSITGDLQSMVCVTAIHKENQCSHSILPLLYSTW